MSMRLLASFVAAAGLAAASARADIVAPPKVAPASFSITVDAPAAKAGAAGQAQVKLAAAPGYHVNKEYPTSLKLTAPAGVDLPQPTISAKNGAVIEEARARFDVAYTAKEAGKKTFTGVLSFAVCTATTCDPHREKVSFTVDVR